MEIDANTLVAAYQDELRSLHLRVVELTAYARQVTQENERLREQGSEAGD